MQLKPRSLSGVYEVHHGTIRDEQPGRYFLIQVGTMQHVVWQSQIQSVYKAGKLYAPGIR